MDIIINRSEHYRSSTSIELIFSLLSSSETDAGQPWPSTYY